MTECFCKTLWSFPGRMENTQVPCPPGRLLEKIMWMKGCSGQKLRRSSSKVDYTKTMLTLTHPRSLVKGDRTRAFLQGRCQFRQRGWMHCFRPAGISAGFLLRTRHQFPCLLSKVSRAKSLINGGAFQLHEDVSLWRALLQHRRWLWTSSGVLPSEGRGGPSGLWFLSLGWGFSNTDNLRVKVAFLAAKKLSSSLDLNQLHPQG